MIKFKKYKDFLYYLYQPNARDFPAWYEFFIDKDTDGVSYPFDSIMSFAFHPRMLRTKEQSDEAAKQLIERYYVNPFVKEMFDRLKE